MKSGWALSLTPALILTCVQPNTLITTGAEMCINHISNGKPRAHCTSYTGSAQKGDARGMLSSDWTGGGLCTCSTWVSLTSSALDDPRC